MKTVEIYTDGACSGNPGAGGWGAILIYKDTELVLSGGEAETTNNRMELMGVIMALNRLKEPCKVNVYSDSAYFVNAIDKGWLDYWMSHGWKTKGKEPVKNVDLWQKIIVELNRHRVSVHKVKGHSDNEYNNRCDELARGEITKLQNN